MPLLIQGVLGQFARAIDDVTLLGELLSDAAAFDRALQSATLVEFREIEDGDISRANLFIEAMQAELGQARFMADDLVRRAEEEIAFTDPFAKRNALYWGNLVSGLTRVYYAGFSGLNPQEGGGVISPSLAERGPFIPSQQMYAEAMSRFERALDVADPGSYRARVMFTAVARVRLYTGDLEGARTAAEQGLREFDAPFEARYSDEIPNAWFLAAGRGGLQVHADFRYIGYVVADTLEQNRVPTIGVLASNGVVFPFQDKYPAFDTPIPILTWQESYLILAETHLAGGDEAAALDYVNIVRASYGIGPLDRLDLDLLVTERDKEFFSTGLRLLDQRRFDRWHLDPGSWQYLPLSQSERDDNPLID